MLIAFIAATLVCCRPEYVVPSKELPKIPAGGVLWLDLTRLDNVSTSDDLELCKYWDALHVSSALQGIVNREQPLMYLDYVSSEGINVDEYWWNKYSQGGEWLAGRERVKIIDPIKACEIFRDKVKGLVVYDPNVAATSNLASMIAGVEDLIPVRYDLRAGSYYNRLLQHGFKPKVWLVNKDGSSKFASKNAAYRWAIDKYLRTGKCDTEFAAYYIDQAWMKNPGAAIKNHHQLSNHDFFVSHRSFFFDLSPWSDEVASDDPSGEVGEDAVTMKEMLLEIYRRNGNGNVFCHIGGFPAWAFKYSNHSKVGGRHLPTETEWKFAEIIGEYNTYHDADAIAYGAMANASFWQHFPLQNSYKQNWISRDQLKAKGYINSNGKVNMDRKYVLLYVGDYDAASWIYQTTPWIWDDPQRGSVPMMWSVSPVLCRRAPQAMHYMWTTATENDYFAAADNGAGYLNPGSLEAPRAISNLPDGMAQWEAHCKKWYEKWGITVTGFIIDGNAKGMTEAGFKAYASFSPNGIVPQKTPSRASLVDGMPILRSGGSANTERASDAISNIKGDVKNHPECPFYWYRAVLKTPSWYATVRDGIDGQDNIAWVSGPEFFELLKCYLENN